MTPQAEPESPIHIPVEHYLPVDETERGRPKQQESPVCGSNLNDSRFGSMPNDLLHDPQ